MDARRKVERLPCEFRVFVSKGDDKQEAECCDISEEGIYLLLSTQAVTSLNGEDSYLEADNRLILTIPQEGAEPIQMYCTIRHVSAITDGRYFIGLYYDSSLLNVRELMDKVV